jgi:Tol biopolymer transport system component
VCLSSVKLLNLALTVLFLASACLSQLAAQEIVSSTNGQIAFTQGDPSGVGPSNVFTANPDGSHAQQVPLGNPVEFFSSAIWSPDGTKLLISHTFRLDGSGQCCLPFRPAIVNPDGSDFIQLMITYGPFDMDCLVWSLDQTRLLCGFGDLNAGVFSVRASDGGDPIRLTTNPYSAVGGNDVPADISPDGARFVFLRYKPSGGPPATPKPDAQVALFVENLDGSGLGQITPYLLADRASAKWSPDGKKIILATRNGSAAMLKGGLFTVSPDGAGLAPINLQVGTQKYSAWNAQYSPDGTRIIFNMYINGGEGIFSANPDGSGVTQVTFTTIFAEQYNGPNWGTHPLAQ